MNKKLHALIAGVLLLGAGAVEAQPKLVVLMIADQARADYFERFRAYLSPDGLNRFYAHGSYYAQAYHDQAITKTGPGHILVGSGLYAYQTGVISNEWFDRQTNAEVASSDIIPGGERVKLKWFAGPSLASRIHKAFPESKVVGVSLKDRGALLFSGPDQDDAYWFEQKKGRFVSYLPAAEWLKKFNAALPAFFQGHPSWSPMVTPSIELGAALDRDAKISKQHLRGDTGLGPDFPHTIISWKGLSMSPFSDELLVALALQAQNEWKLGLNRSGVPDVLTVSFSAVDLVGHEYGPDSLEVMDTFVRLDRSVGNLMNEIEKRVGKDVVWVFSADHGVTSFPEVAQAHSRDGGRVRLKKSKLGVDANALNVSVPYVYFLRPFSPHETETVIRKIEQLDGVDAVYTAGDVKAGKVPDAVRKSFYLAPAGKSSPSGDLYVTLKPGYIFSEKDDTGTTHGQPTMDDQHVPLGFYGEGVKIQRVDDMVSVSQVAPTLLRELGVDAADLSKPLNVFSPN